jgi:rhodanese-related sulfurtransferase
MTQHITQIVAQSISPAEVRLELIAGREIALLDLREEDPYAKDHPLFAVNLPLSRLELEVLDRVPRKDAQVVLYDDGEGLAPVAAERLQRLGYSRVRILEGGLQGWRRAGYELFQDVNSASKAFGELVESRRHTPSLPAPEARALIEGDPNVVVLDARRFDEYRTMSIPRGVSVPGAELVLRARAIAPDPSTTIVVNCAGRTRSIIGAQSLINAGLPNPVFALRNGAIGWTLAGQQLEHGQERRFPEVSGAALDEARAAARRTSYRAGVRRLDPASLAALAGDRSRTLYRFDVRTPEEYAAGHIAGFRSAPGGQLVQETDVYAPVRGARIVLADDKGARADMTASWLAQMGWAVHVLDGGFDGPLQPGWPLAAYPRLPEVKAITAGELGDRLAADDIALIDLAPSPAHRRGHIPGAWFAIRSQLAQALQALPQDRDIALTSPDGALARLAAAEVQALAGRAPLVLHGGTQAWIADGLALETGLDRPANPPTDVYRRPYEGTDHALEAMQAYLDWEFGLVAQLERDGTHGFFVI